MIKIGEEVYFINVLPSPYNSQSFEIFKGIVEKDFYYRRYLDDVVSIQNNKQHNRHVPCDYVRENCVPCSDPNALSKIGNIRKKLIEKEIKRTENALRILKKLIAY